MDEDGEEEESKLNIVTAAILLAAASILVSISVDAVVGSIEDLSSTWGVSNTFVALILLPIAGNAPGKIENGRRGWIFAHTSSTLQRTRYCRLRRPSK